MKKKLLYFWLGFSVLLVMGAIQTIPKLSDLLFRTRYVTNVSELTNTVNNFNALSIDGNQRTIVLGPGTYAMATGTFRLMVSNNICIRGAGMGQTIITGLGSADDPMVRLYDNCELMDLTLQASGTGANPQLGARANLNDPSSTNVVVSHVRLIGDDDNLWLSNAGSVYLIGTFADGSIDWTLNDCEFINHFDAVYIESASGGGGLDARCRARLFGCKIFNHGPSDNATSRARGDVTGIRLLSFAARCEVYGGFLHSSGGTNTTAIAFLGSGPSGADTANLWPGGLYLNGVTCEIIGTNLAAGGVGGCIVQNTNGWVFLNGITCNSNNIVGNGTNFWIQPRRIAASTTTTGTAADTLEKDLFSENLMANTFSADGQALQINAWGSYAATANTKALRVKIGGTTTILDTAGRAINGGGWYLHGTITRVSKTALKSSLLFEAPSFTTNVYTSLTLTSTTNINLRLTGSNHTAAANDLVIEGYKLTHIP